MMKKRIVLATGIALCVALVLGIVGVQAAKDSDTPEKYLILATMTGTLPDGSNEFYLPVEDYGDEVTLPENPFVDNESNFVGWIYQHQIYNPGDKVTAVQDEEVSALWLGKGCIGILTLDSFTGVWSRMEAMADQESGETQSDLQIPSIYEDYFTYEQVDGWFEGWFTEKDGKGEEYIAGDFPDLKADELLVLYAKWNEDLTQAYKVEFNFGSIEENDCDPGYIYVKKGESLTIRDGLSFEGYEFDGWYDKAEGGKYICTTDDEYTPTADTVLYAHWKPAEADDDPTDDPTYDVEINFVDVNEDAYYYNPLKWAVENYITAGTDETHFSPTAKTTRAQMVTFLWRAAGQPVVNYALPFKDVKEDSYYTEAVRWAVSEGITTGTTDTTFSPNANVTREQLATFIYRYAQTKGQGFVGTWLFRLNYSDVDQISSWADEAMHWCTMNRIIKGDNNNQLNPKGKATRAEIVTMLYRYFNLDLDASYDVD